MRKPSLPTLKAKADKLASQYIRYKHADHAGNVTCITCGKVLPWKEAHCAHYIERGKTMTRWVEENLHPACPGCNVYHKEFHKRQYTLAMLDLYGRDKIDELLKESGIVCSSSSVRYLAEMAIDYYGQKLKELNE